MAEAEEERELLGVAEALSAAEKRELLALAAPSAAEEEEKMRGLFDGEKVCGGRVRAGPWNIVLTGVVLFLAFFAFNPIQSFQSSLYEGNSAFFGLGILYAGLMLFTLISGGVVKMMGEKWAMLAGGIAFIIYLVGQIILLKFVILDKRFAENSGFHLSILYIISLIMGIGGSLLYTAQGSLISLCAPSDERGKWNGIFFGIYMLNYVAGGLTMQFVGNHSLMMLFIVLSSVGVLAGLVLLFIHQPLRIIRQAKQHYRFSPLDTIRLFADKRMLLLCPAFFFSGLSATFYYGVLAAEPYDSNGVYLVIFFFL